MADDPKDDPRDDRRGNDRRRESDPGYEGPERRKGDRRKPDER